MKPAASIPFAPECKTIGANLVMNGPDRYMAPRRVIIEKFIALANMLIELGAGRHRLDAAWVSSLIGLFGHMAKFVCGGNALRNSGNMLLRARPGVPKDVRFVDGDGHFAKDIKLMLQKLERKEFLPNVRNARALHGGRLTCAADASMLDEGRGGGFGFIVGSSYAFGL